MADTPEATGAPAAPPQIKSRVLAQYIRDMSFENILAQKGVTGEAQPEIAIQVNLDARKRSVENQFEVITKLNVTSKSKDRRPDAPLPVDRMPAHHVPVRAPHCQRYLSRRWLPAAEP